MRQLSELEAAVAFLTVGGDISSLLPTPSEQSLDKAQALIREFGSEDALLIAIADLELTLDRAQRHGQRETP